jgi:hypothetical protein
MMEVVSASETLVNFYQTAWRNVSEDSNFRALLMFSFVWFEICQFGKWEEANNNIFKDSHFLLCSVMKRECEVVLEKFVSILFVRNELLMGLNAWFLFLISGFM